MQQTTKGTLIRFQSNKIELYFAGRHDKTFSKLSSVHLTFEVVIILLCKDIASCGNSKDF